MADFRFLRVERKGPKATVVIDRPEVHNAFNDQVVSELEVAFTELGSAPGVRAVVLTGAGASFSAGADLNWMRRMIDYTHEENVRDARSLAAMFHTIDRCPRPVIARVQGAALGGGAGLVAVADIALAGPQARFGFTEVRLGIVPAAISPFVLARIGASRARELFLTGERFDSERAQSMGLISRALPSLEELDAEVDRVVQQLAKGGPDAVSAAKDLIFQVAAESDDEKVADFTARTIAHRRASAEGQEGMRAFLEKRAPRWLEEPGS